MTADDLAAQLEALRRRLGELDPWHREPPSAAAKAAWAEWEELVDRELELERALADARGEEHAVPFDLGLSCSFTAPEVELYWDRSDAYLACCLNDREVDALGLVRFVSCDRLSIGPPGSDIPGRFDEHRLFGKGLMRWNAHRVVNSRWADPRGTQQHYLFAFHEEMLEAVAQDVVVSRWEIPMRELMTRVAAGEIDGDEGQTSFAE
jgi:hypothetical protein